MSKSRRRRARRKPTGLRSATSILLWIIPVLVILTPPSECLSAPEPDKAPPVLLTDVTVASGLDFVQTIGDHDMTNIVESAGVGCGFLDYDSDGWMDIYLISGCWTRELSDPNLDSKQRKKLAAATDRLYRNMGDGTFQDVTAAAQLARPAYGKGMVAAD